MDTSRIDDRLRETYERSAPVVNEATFEAQLRRNTNRSRKQASAPRRRNGLRPVAYASIAVVLIAAVAIGSLELVRYLGKDQPVLVITDDTFGPATTGQTTDSVGPTTTGQTTPTATSVEGEHWERLPVSEEGGEVRSLGLDPSNPSVLYAGTQEGLFKSTDAAGSWKQILSLGSGSYYVGIDPTSPSTLYALWVAPIFPEPIKMMRSDDGGSTWRDLSGTDVVLAARQEYAQTGSWAASLEVFLFDKSTDPATVYLGISSTSKEAPDKTVIRLNYWGSSDRGESWTKLDQEEQDQLESTINSPNPALSEFGGKNLPDADGRAIGWVQWSAVADDPEDPSIIYAGTDAGVCKSTDGGETWTKASRGLPGSLVGGKLIVDTNAPSTLYVAAKEGVFKSEDGGASWRTILSVGYMEEGNRLCSLVMAPSATSTLYAWTSDGLFRTDDAGETWSSLGGEGLVPEDSKPFNMTSQLALVAADDPNTLFAVKDDNTLRSTDGGETWRIVLPQTGYSFDGYSVEADPEDPSVMYATTWTLGGSEVGYLYAVVKSTDKGATWTTIVPERPESTFDIALDASDPAGVYTIEYARPSVVSRSLDRGATWENVDYGSLNGPIRHLLFDPQSPQTLYALIEQSVDPATIDLGVFQSTDGGVTWMSVFEGLPSGSLTLALEPAPNGTLYAFGDSGIYKWAPGD